MRSAGGSGGSSPSARCGRWALLWCGVDPRDLLQVASSDDQQPVQALGADGADPPLGVGVRVGRLHRRQQHLGTVRTEDVVEAVGELRVPIAQHKAEPASLLLQHQQQVASLLGGRAAPSS